MIHVCEAGHHDPVAETGILDGEYRCRMLLTTVDIKGYSWSMRHPCVSSLLWAAALAVIPCVVWLLGRDTWPWCGS